MDPDQYVGDGHELEVCLLGVGEEDLGLPDDLHQVGVGQVERGLDVLVREARVEPLLPEIRVRDVVLCV